MDINIAKEVAALRRMTVNELRSRYADVCGEGTRVRNKDWLVKRIAWRLQANAEGDLSERARRRATELANDAELRRTPPKAPTPPTDAPKRATVAQFPSAENRLPPPGSVITRDYKGQTLQVRVLPNGFEFEGEVYRSLSAVAKSITGSHCPLKAQDTAGSLKPHAEHIAAQPHVQVTWSNSHGDHSWMVNLAAEEPDALVRARPGLWEPWRATARATRPERNSRVGLCYPRTIRRLLSILDKQPK